MDSVPIESPPVPETVQAGDDHQAAVTWAENARYAHILASRPARRVRSIDPALLPIATSREGCRSCGVRGDIGCRHQRPLGADA